MSEWVSESDQQDDEAVFHLRLFAEKFCGRDGQRLTVFTLVGKQACRTKDRGTMPRCEN